MHARALRFTATKDSWRGRYDRHVWISSTELITIDPSNMRTTNLWKISDVLRVNVDDRTVTVELVGLCSCPLLAQHLCLLLPSASRADALHEALIKRIGLSQAAAIPVATEPAAMEAVQQVEAAMDAAEAAKSEVAQLEEATVAPIPAAAANRLCTSSMWPISHLERDVIEEQAICEAALAEATQRGFTARRSLNERYSLHDNTPDTLSAVRQEAKSHLKHARERALETSVDVDRVSKTGIVSQMLLRLEKENRGLHGAMGA